MEDYVYPTGKLSERGAFLAGKAATLAWGLFAVAFSYQVEAIAPTVLEAINKIGSVANGPLLALFTAALLFPGVGQRRAVIGFAAGMAANLSLWLFVPQVSWLWWNVAGCVVSLLVTLLGRTAQLRTPSTNPTLSTWIWLVGASLLILGICYALGVRV